MARRRKGEDPFFIFAQGFVALIALSFLHPATRAGLNDLLGLVRTAVFAVLLLIFAVGIILLIRLIWKVTELPSKTDQLPDVYSGPQFDSPSSVSPVNVQPIKLPPGNDDDSRYQPKPQRSLSEQLRAIDWFQFEKLVALAYGATGIVARKGGANPDGGIDLILDQHGEQIGLQCKHWKSWKVGVKTVREMLGAMTAAGLKKGIVVSLNPYTQEAIDFAAKYNIELVNEQGVIGLLKHLDQSEVQAILSDTRKVCPKCEREMVLRTATKGFNAGGQFWGCTGYPKCRFILQASGAGTVQTERY